jgi:DNA polymerase II small subunit/DNA polymerase delta subunit B
MNNLQRLQLETKGIKLEQDELIVYLQENDLQPFDEYNPQSATSKKNIYRAALSILESIANNPSSMKAYKMDDTTVSDFHENLMNRIDQLERKIRTLKTDEQLQNESNFFMLFAD